MICRTSLPPSLLLLILSFLAPSYATPPNLEEVLSPDNLMPQGEYYEDVVPDTLDLAERAKASIHGLTSFLNEKKNYSPYGHAFYNVKTPYMTTLFTGPDPCWSKTLDAMVLARLMCGSDLNLDIQSRSFLAGTAKMADANQRLADGRLLMALMTLYDQNPDPRLKEAITSYADQFQNTLITDRKLAYFPDWGPELQPDMKDAKYGVLGYGWNVFVQGTALRGLSRYATTFDDPRALESSGKLKSFLMQPKYWFPEAGPKAVVGSEHGQYMGHHHSYAACLMGLISYAEATGDVRLMQFVRDSYEYMRTFGIARIGLFAEMCTTGDMMFLAMKLSDLGVGDYWDDVDCYLRNQIAETQILDPEKLRRAIDAEPILARLNPKAKEDIIQPVSEATLKRYEMNLNEETEEHVIDRTVGCYLSCSSHPTHIPKHQFLWTICCTGNVTPALYWAWDAAARFNDDDDSAQVNLLLNRAAPWLDVHSYLPYQGKVVIKNKMAKVLSVRIPVWVDKEAVQSEINGEQASPMWVNRYLVFSSLNPQDSVVITFPMVETTETYSLKWKEADFWLEGTNPGTEWKPQDKPDRFTFRIKGNTVVEVTPKYEGGDYPLYLRSHFDQTDAPMKKVSRFVTSTVVKW